MEFVAYILLHNIIYYNKEYCFDKKLKILKNSLLKNKLC